MNFTIRQRVKNITNEAIEIPVTRPLKGEYNVVTPDMHGNVRIQGELVELMDARYGHIVFDYISDEPICRVVDDGVGEVEGHEDIPTDVVEEASVEAPEGSSEESSDVPADVDVESEVNDVKS